MVRIHQPKPRQTLLTLLVATFILTACQSKGSKVFDPMQVAFSAEYNHLFDGQLYPSLILSGSDLNTFNVSVIAPADNCVLRVVIDSSAINYVTIIQEIMPKRGQQYTFEPSVKWKYDALRHMRQPSAVDLTFTCYINDEEVDIKNLHFACRSVNECPLSFRTTDAEHSHQIVDTRYLFAAYVNEDHPSIPEILSEILSQGTVSRFSGYQSSAPNSVRDQVFAVWYYALSHGITYSSISCTSNPSSNTNVQHIRFFDEVYSSRQANCVDACVFFASILRKIGLKPVIFVEPCHAYLGYYTDKNRKNIALLETTITSWVNFPELERSLDSVGRLPNDKFNKISKYLSDSERDAYHNGNLSFEQLKLAIAHSLFDKATEYDRDTFQQNRDHFADSTSITYQQLDIEQLRQIVQPIN